VHQSCKRFSRFVNYDRLEATENVIEGLALKNSKHILQTATYITVHRGVCKGLSLANSAANPKSTNFRQEFGVSSTKSMFSGLMSRCAIPLLCMNDTAERICRNMSWARSSLNIFSRRMRANNSPIANESRTFESKHD
jgi:hypothetical protein